MKPIIKSFFILTTMAVISVSCQKEIHDGIPATEPGTSINAGEGVILLGKQLENPYSVNNMKKALAELKQTGELKSGVIVETTHYYVRFLPASEQELDLLKQDESLELYDYPLDYEMEEGGVYYHDPSLPADQITWQYTVVPHGYIYPEIKYEIIESLYLPEEGEENLKSGDLVYFDWLKLEDKALEITGNDEEIIQEGISLKASKWIPAGRILVWDDVVEEDIPLVGAKVRARRWFTTHTGITDSKGNYSCDGSFRNNANYSIKWERSYWDIRSGSIGQAYFNGPKQRGDWNLNIKGGQSLHYASIHRAAYRHLYGYNLGIKRPVKTRNGKWKICYYDKNGTGDFWGNIGSPGGILPDIRIYGSSGSSQDPSRVFRTTAHELGHASHCVSMGNIQYWQVSKIIYESWADAVEWALINQEYKELGVVYTTNDLHEYSAQFWPYINLQSNLIRDKREYSSLFIDLVDSYNQSIRNTEIRIYPNDNVRGYSMSQLSSIVAMSYGLASLKINLKADKPNSVTDNQIEELFERYEEVW